MTDVERLLTAELEDLGARAPHDPDLAASVRRRARRQAAVLASALAVLLLVAGGAVAATRLRPAAAPVASTPTTQPATGCPTPEPGTLPVWARAGFSSPNPGIPMVYSDRGLMLAILFGSPLTAPPAADHNNKILWVAKVGAEGAFSIDARLEGTDVRVQRAVAPAPGPSIVDLPAAGCWQVDLRWGTYSDTISLRYAPG
jgi:hypothetical protein